MVRYLKTPNTLMAQPLPPTPPVLPPIRTLADDLAAASSGKSGAFEFQASGSPMPSVPRSSAAGAQPIALPPHVPRQGRGRLLLFVSLVFGIALVGFGIWGALRFLPRASGTVADVVPADAIAFVSVRVGQPGTDSLLAVLTSAFEGLTPVHLQSATDVTYVLLPGPSPAEPVAALLVRGLSTVDLSASPGLSPHPIFGGLFIVETTHRGRVEGLADQTWGREAEFRKLVRGMPSDAPVLAVFRSSVLEALLQPFAPHPVLTDAALVLALRPSEGTATASVQGRTNGEITPSVAGRGAGVALALPSGLILASSRPSFTSDVATLPASGKLPSSLASVLRVFGEQNEEARQLADAVAGPWTLGVLPTEVPGIRDVVAIVPLKSGADPRASLRTLESVFQRLGPYLAGSDVPGAAFSEAEVRGVAVRYVNFGSPARAFDYAVVSDALLLATSRPSMAALIDAGRGEHVLTDTSAFASLKEAAQGADWFMLLADERIRSEVPVALAVFHDLFRGIVVRPTGPRSLEGLAMLGSPSPAPAENLPGSPVRREGVPPSPEASQGAEEEGLGSVPPEVSVEEKKEAP